MPWIYALTLLVLVVLAWHFYMHRLLTTTLFRRVSPDPYVGKILSIVTLIAAVFIVWSISGISVIEYVAALIGSSSAY